MRPVCPFGARTAQTPRGRWRMPLCTKRGESVVDKLPFKRDRCLVCEEKLPLLRHLSINCINGAECPKCNSYMKFSGYICVVQLFIYAMIFPVLVFFEQKRLLGFLCLLFLVLISILVAYFSPYKIDPSHESRLEK